MRTIAVLNGPNLNLLGTRETAVYGTATLADVEAICAAACAPDFGVRTQQSNHEGQLVDWIHAAREDACGIVINPGAYTHTSVAILDALNAFDGPVVEVHLTNVHRREAFRHRSYVSLRADGIVAGFGVDGYAVAVRRVCALVAGAGAAPA